MDRNKIQSFITTAESGLASIRSSLLIIAQTGDASDLSSLDQELARLRDEARSAGLAKVETLTGNAILEIDSLAASPGRATASAFSTLDIITQIEEAVWQFRTGSEEFPDDVSGFIDASFSELVPIEPKDTWVCEDLDVDEETLDVFRTEANDLLGQIVHNLEILASSPSDNNALWEVRRHAHTFKGAAGIVGLSDAAAIAHRMEDLLDKTVEIRSPASAELTAFLSASADRLRSIVDSKEADENTDLSYMYEAANSALATDTKPITLARGPSADDSHSSGSSGSDAYRPSRPIVRVSLDRLDELIKLSHSLVVNRSALTERFSDLHAADVALKDTVAKLNSIFDAQLRLTDELHTKLLRIRMVRFGTLETRLNRTVQTTCTDEGKKARIELHNADVEIDTQIIDSLIEPLLHLLKNAVVHGIESPDTRRLIGKPETGTVTVNIEADSEAIVLVVSDDGGGISIAKLKEKAISAKLISPESAEDLGDRDAMMLIFDRGLTTSDSVNLNSGRGIGMSIVKDAVEKLGGSVHVESKPRLGTTFTILMPIAADHHAITASGPAEGTASGSLAPLALIVDDSASVRHKVTKIVEKAGMRAITADNGADALELLLNGTIEPDLILSDIEMPQIDGWEFLEYVKTDENFGHIPVVMVSSLDGPENRERALNLGAIDYLVKPFTDAAMDKIIEAVGISVTA